MPQSLKTNQTSLWRIIHREDEHLGHSMDDPEWRTELRARNGIIETVDNRDFTLPVVLSKGEEIGLFKFGSCVAIIFEHENSDIMFNLTRKQKVCYGHNIICRWEPHTST